MKLFLSFLYWMGFGTIAVAFAFEVSVATADTGWGLFACTDDAGGNCVSHSGGAGIPATCDGSNPCSVDPGWNGGAVTCTCADDPNNAEQCYCMGTFSTS